MRLAGPSGALPPTVDLAAALAQARDHMGHRPAITVLGGQRQEQGYVSLAQWAAKGAHLLEVDHDAGPGARIAVDAPAGWLVAATCLAVWWVGATVVLHGGAAADVRLDLDAYAEDVLSFPDAPPAPRAGGEHVAVEFAELTWTQRELLDIAERWGLDGPLGVAADAAPEVWVPAIVRPLRSGRATVIFDDTSDSSDAMLAAEGVLHVV